MVHYYILKTYGRNGHDIDKSVRFDIIQVTNSL